jgi:hypothetical protein
VSLKSATVWVAVLLVAGLLDSSCIYRWGHDGGVRRRERGG